VIIDGHCHFGPLPVKGTCPGSGPRLAPFRGEDLIEGMKEDGIDITIGFSDARVLDNEYIAKMVKKFPDEIIGFAFINPLQKTATDQLKRAIEVLGLTGMKLHPYSHGYALSSHAYTDPLFKVCIDRDLPIIVHGGDTLYSHPYEFEEMARVFPEAKIIMAHMGFMFACEQARRVAERRKNVYLDTAAAAPDDVRLAVECAGANKIVMGSDNPFWSPKLEVAKIEVAVSDASKRNLILGENYRKLLKL